MWQALDLESSLSRASIVWALGELKFQAALPVLASLYAEAKTMERRSNAVGHRFAQQAAIVTSQYDRISNLESLAAEWDELKAASLTPIVDPSSQEELLQTQQILDAVAKIGPELSQAFYRSLASSKDIESRQAAAEQLSAATPTDREKNVAVLTSLLADSEITIRMRAAVGLILLGNTSGQGVILEALNSKQDWEVHQVLIQLARLTNPDQRTFCVSRLAAIEADLSASEATRTAANAILKQNYGFPSR